MRGSPRIHLLLLAVAFALVALPLSRLTCGPRNGHEHAAGQGTTVVHGSDEHPEGEHVHHLPVRVRVRFAHPPEALSLLAGERNLVEDAVWEESPVEFETELDIGHDGNEFVLEARWPEGTPQTAVTVELEPEGLEARSETRWSEEGEVSDVLTFAW